MKKTIFNDGIKRTFKYIFIIFFSITSLTLLGCESQTKIVEKEKYCEGNYVLLEGRCTYMEQIEANKKIKYTCLDNDKLEGTECVSYYETPAYQDISCPANYRSYGTSRCKFKFSGARCGVDGISYMGYCYPQYVSATGSGYFCYYGELRGSVCIQKFTYQAMTGYDYSCPSGYDLEYDKCYYVDFKEPKER